METVITKKNKNTEMPSGKKAPLFRTTNYIIMGVGILLLIIGLFCLRGGAVADPNTFDGEIFNTRRIVVAPILMFLGLVTEIVAIMWHPRASKKSTDNPEA